MYTKNKYLDYLGEEELLHVSLCDYLDFKYPHVLYFHPLNAARRTHYERWYAHKMRMRSGVSDLIIQEAMHGYHGAVMELKAKNKKLTESQIDYLTFCQARNIKTAVIYNMSEGVSFLDDYLN